MQEGGVGLLQLFQILWEPRLDGDLLQIPGGAVADDDWPAVVQNLEMARAVWRRMTRILSREGAELRLSGFFFKVVVQSVLLFGAETWLVTPHMGRVLGGFQDQLVLRLTGWLLQRRSDRKWKYTSAAAAKAEAGFEAMKE